jgi:hypothetical protein
MKLDSWIELFTQRLDDTRTVDHVGVIDRCRREAYKRQFAQLHEYYGSGVASSLRRGRALINAMRTSVRRRVRTAL